MTTTQRIEAAIAARGLQKYAVMDLALVGRSVWQRHRGDDAWTTRPLARIAAVLDVPLEVLCGTWDADSDSEGGVAA